MKVRGRGAFLTCLIICQMFLDPGAGRPLNNDALLFGNPWVPGVCRGRAGELLKPPAPAPKFKEGSNLAVSRVWHVAPGPENEPETVYAGVEPAALFRSADRGEIGRASCRERV